VPLWHAPSGTDLIGARDQIATRVPVGGYTLQSNSVESATNALASSSTARLLGAALADLPSWLSCLSAAIDATEPGTVLGGDGGRRADRLAATAGRASVVSSLDKQVHVIALAHGWSAGMAFRVMGKVSLVVRRADHPQPAVAQLVGHRPHTRCAILRLDHSSKAGQHRSQGATWQSHRPILPHARCKASLARSAWLCAAPGATS
jgi:hypothetical protein